MKYLYVFLLIILFPSSSAAHYVVGEVYDALDSTSANGKTVALWNPAIGMSDNVTDIIGQTGNSGIDNVYFVDCEMLSIPCEIGDTISAIVLDQGDGYSAGIVNMTITDAGYDVMPNMTIALQIDFINLSLDDSYKDILNEIDLIPASTRLVSCEGITYGPNMDINIQNISSSLFNNATSYYSDSDQNNKHYTNSSCNLNTSYGDSDQVYFNCSYYMQYYSIPGNWSCGVEVIKSPFLTRTSYTNNQVNSLLALELPDLIHYGVGQPTLVSDEKTINVSNAGNTALNLSIQAYGITPGDNISMSCPNATVKNISLDDQRYNLTAQNSGPLTLVEFQSKYKNLSSTPVINKFNLDSRQNDIINDAIKSTYWRVYLQEGINDDCTGNIIFGAVNAAGT